MAQYSLVLVPGLLGQYSLVLLVPGLLAQYSLVLVPGLLA